MNSADPSVFVSAYARWDSQTGAISMALMEEVYHRLREAFGPQLGWPGDSPLEAMVAAVLTQNTSWANVQCALDNLRHAGLLSLPALATAHIEELAERIRPAGYVRLKARRLHNLTALIQNRYTGSLEQLFSQDAESLRAELVQVNGIGPETADTILLYAARKPTFVVDSHTARVLKRHGWIAMDEDYYAIKDYLEGSLEQDAPLLQEYHALLVTLGTRYCRRQPQCAGCPLEPLLPEGGPLSLD